jgi:hypothetical protein
LGILLAPVLSVLVVDMSRVDERTDLATEQELLEQAVRRLAVVPMDLADGVR